VSWRCWFGHRWTVVASCGITAERHRRPPFSFDYEVVAKDVPGVFVLERCVNCPAERGFRDVGDLRTFVSGVYARSRLEEWGVLPAARP
jgi:hypothetical protein